MQFVTHATGDWTLRFVIITLAITPFRKTLHLPLLIRFRVTFAGSSAQRWPDIVVAPLLSRP